MSVSYRGGGLDPISTSSTVSSELFEDKAKRLLKTEDFRSFHEFYPYYLSEHSNLVCR